ncbi:MAG: reprolysin-like metallopeptidase, partial [Nevskiales bacterium]
TQAAITTGTARINQIYERELSINLTLVNNTDIIFTNAATDPYTTANDNAQVTENQAAIDTAVGNANYDVGHVLDTGGAGLAAGSSVCNAAQKAQGKSANSPHFGDALYVDYVAHEIGHQFGANHSYNTVTSTCNTRNPSTAYEPGSGSTIMAYANICGGGEDLQQLSDPNFHYVSLDEMLTFTAPGTGGGDACAAKTASNASDPTVSAGANFTIPKSTPFELTAVNGSDAESPANQLTHSWEQYDLSANAQTLPQTAADTSTGPLMRSFPPVFSPTRSFPRLSTVLGGAAALGEILPAVARELNFRVTIRDNAANGRIGTSTMKLTVDGTSGPFHVTAPAQGANVDSTANVVWDVAGTAAAPVNAQNVDISFSRDNGVTFAPVMTTANDGMETVNLTGAASGANQARIKVKGSNNVFYNVSPAFTFAGGTHTVEFAVGAQTRAENAGAVPVVVKLSAASTQDVTVQYSVAGSSTAVSPDDFSLTPANSITIPAGQTQASITANIVDDTLVEPTETVILTLSAPTNATLGAITQHTLSITDNDSPPPPPKVEFVAAAQTQSESAGAVP